MLTSKYKYSCEWEQFPYKWDSGSLPSEGKRKLSLEQMVTSVAEDIKSLQRLHAKLVSLQDELDSMLTSCD
jgi:hypothetical protein